MRILVYPNTMSIGGAQISAMQLAGAIRDRGHEVIVASQPGRLVQRVGALDLQHIEVPAHRHRPSFEAIRVLTRVARERTVDVIHAYESTNIVEAFFGPRLRNGTPVLGTVMSMSVRSSLPRSIPLTVGSEQIRLSAAAKGFRRVSLLEPPVDIEADNPVIDGSVFRARNGIEPNEVLVAVVCRLVPHLKLEGLRMACEAIGALACVGSPLRLLIVGDGDARNEVAKCAEKANRAAGRQAILLTGELLDPRPAYAAADVVLGQGGSALRGMAFGKPLIVLGELGFVELLTATSAPMFLQQGWYGLGPGSFGAGAPALRLALEQLVASPDLRRELGAFGRQLAVDRFSLGRIAQLLEQQYVAARHTPVTAPLLSDILRTTSGVLGSKLRRRYGHWRGKADVDNPNALPEIRRFASLSGTPSSRKWWRSLTRNSHQSVPLSGVMPADSPLEPQAVRKAK
jgi:glycosyltransferase involved in cell wall biosynthesis